MTDKRIVYTNPYGFIDVIIPDPNEMIRLAGENLSEPDALGIVFGKAAVGQIMLDNPGMTEDDAIAEYGTNGPPASMASPRQVTIADLPSDRIFRNAWVNPGAGPVTVDVDKARALAEAMRSAHLEEKLKALDREENYDLPDAARVAAIATERQGLVNTSRTAKAAINAATTEQELRDALTAGGVIP